MYSLELSFIFVIRWENFPKISRNIYFLELSGERPRDHKQTRIRYGKRAVNVPVIEVLLYNWIRDSYAALCKFFSLSNRDYHWLSLYSTYISANVVKLGDVLFFFHVQKVNSRYLSDSSPSENSKTRTVFVPDVTCKKLPYFWTGWPILFTKAAQLTQTKLNYPFICDSFRRAVANIRKLLSSCLLAQ